MITIDLKNRRTVNAWSYSTFGHDLGGSKHFTDLTGKALATKTDSDGLMALKAILATHDHIFQISTGPRISAPGLSGSTDPASGWEDDW